MAYSLIVLTVSAFMMLVAGFGLDAARRQFTRKRNDHRMSQALRRGLARPEGPWTRQPQVIEW
jgi:hypothetical protein